MRFSETRAALYAEMDAVYKTYPADMTTQREAFDHASFGMTPYERKLLAYRIMGGAGNVILFPHDPFFHELNTGKARNAWMGGFCDHARATSGVDLGWFAVRMRRRQAANLTQGASFADMDHRVLGYDNLLRYGLGGLASMAAAANETETDPQKRTFRETEIETLGLLRGIAGRFAAHAAVQAPTCTGDARKNLERIAVAARKIPWEAPQTFYEALASIVFMREITNALEGVGISSYGHLDRMLAPYYARDLAAGRITREEAYDLLASMLSLTDGRYDYSSGASVETSTTVMIGGQDSDGVPVWNDVTEMIIEAFEEFRFVNPKLNARVCDESPDAYLRALARLQLSGANVLAVENDPANIRYLQNQGVSERDARLYVGCGCQELTVQNTAYHSRAFLYVNLVQPLLNVLKEQPDAPFDTLYAAYFAALGALLADCIADCAPFDTQHTRYNAELIVSTLLSDCIARGLDVTEGGSRYRFKTFTLVGFGTLADSFLALKNFPDRAALLSSMAADFKGAEDLRRTLERLPRYGDADARSFVRVLASDLSHAADGLYPPEGVHWGTSIFTYWAYGTFGHATGATPDGRHAHTPFTRGGGPSDLAISRAGLTSAALAVSDTFADFTDTSVFDFTLPATPGAVSEEAYAAFLRAACKLRIPVLQCNLASRELLREEHDHPGTHPALVVRVCGYSALFASLSRDVQNEVLARVPHF
ncbi:MAG: pyruvate formate lyase family protein [Clostridiaceae bacterium]|nr:pyruvate formate lyase family protein [Clostridiaceae bacterium]